MSYESDHEMHAAAPLLQVVIKVKGTEPSQLRSDMTTAVSRALVNQG
jgi:hypothetical protein